MLVGKSSLNGTNNSYCDGDTNEWQQMTGNGGWPWIRIH